MPRYYCDYCDTYLTHDSPSVRKQHNSGYKHKANVRTYYQQFEEQQTQSLIDQKIKEHIGQTAVFQQQGAAQFFPPRPRPILPPFMPPPNMAGMPPGMPPGMRPAVYSQAVPVYSSMMPSMMISPPGAPTGPPMPLPRPPGPPGTSGVTTNGGPPMSMSMPTMYQANPTAPTSGGYGENYNSMNSSNAGPPTATPMPLSNTGSLDGYAYSRASDDED